MRKIRTLYCPEHDPELSVTSNTRLNDAVVIYLNDSYTGFRVGFSLLRLELGFRLRVIHLGFRLA